MPGSSVGGDIRTTTLEGSLITPVFRQHEREDMNDNEYVKWNTEDRLTTQTVKPDSVEVIGGRLSIITPEQTAPRIGLGSTVLLDGIELKQVRRIVLDICADEPITATIELYA